VAFNFIRLRDMNAAIIVRLECDFELEAILSVSVQPRFRFGVEVGRSHTFIFRRVKKWRVSVSNGAGWESNPHEENPGGF